MRGILILLAMAGVLLLGAETKAATYSTVTLGWNPSTSSGVTGYYIYYSTNSDLSNATCVPVGNVTNVSLSLPNGQTFYFAASSHDGSYNESSLSSEISAAIGTVAQAAGLLNAAVGLPAGQFGFALTGAANTQYIVQASTDLVHWVALQTNTGSFQFVDSNASQYSHRFYRTVSVSN
jgi:hypothetical protein